MEQLDRILCDPENPNQDFAVHITDRQQLSVLTAVLKKHGFAIALDLFGESPAEWLQRTAEEDGFDTCCRLRSRAKEKSVFWNPSIEHWRLYCRDILEEKNGRLDFHEGKYTPQAARIEAQKIHAEAAEGGALQQPYGGMTAQQITDALLQRG